MFVAKYVLFFLVAFLIGLAAGLLFLFPGNVLITNDILPAIPPAQEASFSLENAPSQSLRGKLISLNGDVYWQSRTATTSSPLTPNTILQQGENITTGTSGTITIAFDNIVNVNLLPNSDLDLIQTLPSSMVFNQNQGVVTYTPKSFPVSVRNRHLLIKINPGQAVVSLNPDLPALTIDVKKGSVSVAYNNLQYHTVYQTIDQGHSFNFNDSSRVGIIR